MNENEILVDLFVSGHNHNIMTSAMNTINDFLSDKNFKLYFYDEEGNVFKPKGKMTHVLMDTHFAEE